MVPGAEHVDELAGSGGTVQHAGHSRTTGPGLPGQL
jgi:hypothetical protein